MGLTRYIRRRLQASATDLYVEAHAPVERHLPMEVQRRASSNQSQTARILGINRATLRSKLAALGISIEHSSSLDGGALAPAISPE